MAEKNPNRESYFPAIEKKYGQPMSYWFAQMANLGGNKYPEQIAFLKEEHGFSQTHANALVMFSRGSKSSRRFDTVNDYLAQCDKAAIKTVQKIFKAIRSKYPELDLVIAWNQPMLKVDRHYVFGIMVLKNHILMAPWSTDVLGKFSKRLKEYEVKKKTIQIPLDWIVDAKLLQDMVKARLKEITK